MYARVAAIISGDLPRRFLADPLLPISSGDVEDPLGFGSGDRGGAGKSVDGSDVTGSGSDQFVLGLKSEGEREEGKRGSLVAEGGIRGRLHLTVPETKILGDVL